jgi:hypothetical protein
MEEDHKDTFRLLVSKGALSSSPPSENSEAEQIPVDPNQKEASHRKVSYLIGLKFESVVIDF